MLLAEKPLGIFISHIHEEAEIGVAVKSIVEDVFSRDGVRAFLSSDSLDIPAGRKWLDEIASQLDKARVVVSLLSPTSIRRPWVNIELGAAWIKGIRVIPFCHSGLSVNELPRPFGDFNAVGFDDDNAVERLLGGIADGFGLTHPKRLAFDKMRAEIEATFRNVRPAAEAAEQEVTAENLLPAERRILITLARHQNRGDDVMEWRDLAAESEVPLARFTHHITRLSDLGFAHIGYFTTGDREVRLTSDGSGWLIEHGAMPD
jgi:hypothetical protein